MKKIFMSILGVFLMTAGMQAQELVQDGEFDKADFSIAYGKAGDCSYGVWCVNNTEAPGVATIQVVDDKQRGKVAQFSVDPKLTTWYKAFVAQRYEGTVEPGIYRLTFWAKSKDGGEVKAFVRLTNEDGKDLQRFFVCNQSKPKKDDRKFYGGFAKAAPGMGWKQYTADFDFRKVTNTIYAFTMQETEDATETDLTNFSICFQNSSAEGTTILVDGISLQKLAE